MDIAYSGIQSNILALQCATILFVTYFHDYPYFQHPTPNFATAIVPMMMKLNFPNTHSLMLKLLVMPTVIASLSMTSHVMMMAITLFARQHHTNHQVKALACTRSQQLPLQLPQLQQPLPVVLRVIVHLLIL